MTNESKDEQQVQADAGAVSDGQITVAWLNNGGSLNGNNYQAFARSVLSLAAHPSPAAESDKRDDAAAKLAEIDAGLDFEPDDQHTIADMANVGRALMKAIETHRPDYSPMCCPSEIVGDLCNELDEARITEETAMRVSHAIIAKLEDRAGYFDSVDDETMSDIADDIAVMITSELQGGV